MFTGIVEIAGEVHGIEPRADGIELLVRARFDRTLKIGESVAVNGCCLTVEKIRARGKEGLLQFGVLNETWKRTNLQFAKPGSRVNLERALRVGDRLGGHFVSGHIDDVGKIKRWEQAGKDYLLEIAAPPELMRYVVFKGSIAVDGISLTVAKVRQGSFEVWIIPHTRAVTALKERRAGDAVNLETDMLGKFVERFVSERSPR
ncbi:MAG TPA: riboflavin synthase [Verrucomicrobiae bacterium]|jgi:riboflavin synthase|nr:riboflavin synthase [Verrucomicrobiae bacterium]